MATVAERQLFIYRGKNRKGEKVEGEMHADNLIAVRGQLRKQGIISTSIKKKTTPLFSRPKKIVPADIALFTRQLATMMKAGVPLVQSFDIVSDGVDKPAMRELILQIRDDVSAGGSFANSLRRHPRFLMICFAVWSIPVRPPGRWRPCSTGWRPIKKRPNN